MAAIILAGCAGGGGGDGNAGGDRVPVSGRIAFDQSLSRSVFAEGKLAFSITPALAADESVSCNVAESNGASCAIDEQSGQVEFSGLPLGRHTIQVRITKPGGVVAAEANHALQVERPDVVVYGATPGGIAAALAASRAGQAVVLLEPTSWVGGMMSGGLAKTDIGARGREIIGGIAAEFFQRVRQAESANGACANGCAGVWDFEPHVAERVFEQMLAESGVIIERSARLLDVHREGSAIERVSTSRGEVSARMFIDASYEGDLMAKAGVAYVVGREARQIASSAADAEQLALQEDLAGVQRYGVPLRTLYADPYVVAGDPSSGVLPFLESRPSVMPAAGEGDGRVMAYTYRLCVTDDPSNHISFAPPPDYQPARFEAMARIIQARQQAGHDIAQLFDPARTVRSRGSTYMKYDLNGGTTFSIDMTAPDLNQRYVEGSEAEREQVRQDYRRYIQGLLYFWRTDPRFPALNQKVGRFGLCADEFADRGGWPHQLYVREARRMVGAYIMREADVLQNGRRAPIADPVGFGAYDIDMHTYRYFAAPVNWPDGTRREAIVREGFLIVRLPQDRPYPISYRSLIPSVGDATNFLNPVTPSASHVAQSSMRMEPTFMILGQAAGTAAALAVELGVSVQEVPYDVLRPRLVEQGQQVGN